MKKVYKNREELGLILFLTCAFRRQLSLGGCVSVSEHSIVCLDQYHTTAMTFYSLRRRKSRSKHRRPRTVNLLPLPHTHAQAQKDHYNDLIRESLKQKKEGHRGQLLGHKRNLGDVDWCASNHRFSRFFETTMWRSVIGSYNQI